MTETTKRCSSNFDFLPWQRHLGYFCKNFKLLLFCFSMESSHFLAISSPWQKLQNVVLRILIFLPWQRHLGYFCKNFKLLLLFCFSMESSHFWPLVLRDPLYKTFFDFWFRPPNTQNWLPKIWQKIAYNSACMADRPEMFVPNRGFSGMADWMEPYKMLSGPPLLPWQWNLG